MRRRLTGGLLALVVIAACAADGSGPTPTPSIPPPSPTAQATPTSNAPHSVAPRPSASNSARLEADALAAALRPATMERHLGALQQIADVNGGHRASGSPGFAASIDYVEDELETVGFDVERHTWEVDGRTGTNLIVEREGHDGHVIMLGAHLDSVSAGPGINDDGSGVAVVLAVAEALAALPAPDRTIRLALWDAEEGGPFGSAAYVAGLTAEERERVGAYLNLDMIGSPNAIRRVYAEADAAAGSADITGEFAAYFERLGLPWEPIDLDGDSDHGPFTAAGIPTGGLFSGGIEPVTEGQAALFGALAGVPADACSHAACDTIDNVDTDTLVEMARAAAWVLGQLATTD